MTGAVNNRRTNNMARTIRTKVYKFNELSKEAKENAMDWWRGLDHYEWWESTYEDFKELCKHIGLEVDLSNTFFSGFAHQGQGATFEAYVNLIELIEGIEEKRYLTHAPNIEKEARFNPSPCDIDKRVLKLIKNGEIDVSISLQSNDRPYSTKVSVSTDYTYNQCSEYTNIDRELEKLEEWIEEIVGELDSLLFKLLENEYDYFNSDESVSETIMANDYEFTKDGRRF